MRPDPGSHASGIAAIEATCPYRMLVSDVDVGVSQTPHGSTHAARPATSAFHLLYSAIRGIPTALLY